MEKQEQPKMGRVVFYMPIIDIELLRDLTRLRGVKTSFFIRNIVMENLDKSIYEPKIIPDDYKQLLHEIVKQGINLNQIAKKLNKEGEVDIISLLKVKSSIEKLNEVIVAIKLNN